MKVTLKSYPFALSRAPFYWLDVDPVPQWPNRFRSLLLPSHLPFILCSYHLIAKRMAFSAHQEHGQAVGHDQCGEAMYRAKGVMDKPRGGLWKAHLVTFSVPRSPSFWLRVSWLCSPYSDVTAFQEGWTPPLCCLPPPPNSYPFLGCSVIFQASSLAEVSVVLFL